MNEEYLRKVFEQTGLDESYYESFKSDMSSNADYNNKVFQSLGLDESYYDAFKADTGLVKTEVEEPKGVEAEQSGESDSASARTTTSLLDSEEPEFTNLEPKQEDDKSNLTWMSFLRGSAKLGEDILRTPEFIYDLFATPQNLISELAKNPKVNIGKLTGLPQDFIDKNLGGGEVPNPVFLQNQILKKIGVDLTDLEVGAEQQMKKYDIDNTIADYYAEEQDKLTEKIDKLKLDNYEEDGVWNNIKSGNYMDAFELAGAGLAESAPFSLSMMAGGAATSLPKLSAATTAVLGSGERRQLGQENPDMGELEKTVKAFGLAGAESVFSSISSGTMGKVYGDIIKKEGVEKGSEIFKAGLIKMYETALKKGGAITGAIGEGIEETATQITQNMIKGIPAMEGVEDAFILGVSGGAMYGSPINVVNAVNKVNDVVGKRKVRKIVNDGNNDFIDLTDAFEPSRDFEVAHLELFKNPKTRDLLEKDLDRLVEAGDITESDKDAHIKKYLEGVSSSTMIKDAGIGDESIPKVMNLVSEKVKLQSEIKGMDDILASKRKERIEQINSELKSLVDGETKTEEKVEEARTDTTEEVEVESKPKEEEDVVESVAKTTEDTGLPLNESRGKTVGDSINREVRINSIGDKQFERPVKGDLYTEGQRVILDTRDGNQYDLGNIDDISEIDLRDIEEFSITSEDSRVKTTNNGNIEFQGNEYRLPKSVDRVTKFNEAGDVTSVKIKPVSGGKQVTLRGQNAVDAYYQTKLNELQTQEQESRVDESIKREIEDSYEKQESIRKVKKPTKKKADGDTKKDKPIRVDKKPKLKVSEEVSKAIDNVSKALSKFAPKANFIILSNSDYNKKSSELGNVIPEGSISTGMYDPSTDTIYINSEYGNSSTVFHEAGHALLKNYAGGDSKVKDIADKFVESLTRSLKGDPLLDDINKFLEVYGDSDVKSEEAIVEIMAVLAANSERLSPKTKNVIKRFLDRLARMLGLKVNTTDTDVIDFLNTVAGKFEKGEVIVDSDLNSLGVSGTIKVKEGSSKPKNSLVRSIDLKRLPKNEGVKVSENVNISTFNGKNAFVFESDRMTGAALLDDSGNPLFKFLGGVYYPIITGKWWASRVGSKANSIANSGNNSRDKDGYIYGMPVLNKPESHLSNQDMFDAAWSFIQGELLNKGTGLNKSQIVDKINGALSTKLFKAKGFKDKVGIKKYDNISTIISKVNSKLLDPKLTTFDMRKAFVNSMLGTAKKPNFPTAGSIKDFASKFIEPITEKADSGTGNIVTVMRTKGNLSYRKSNPNDPQYHKSYPYEIVSDAPIEVIILDSSNKVWDIMPVMKKKDGETFNWEGYKAKHDKISRKWAEGQYSRTAAKLSYARGKIKSDGKPKVKNQLDNKKWDTSKRGPQRLEGAPLMKKRKNVSGADPELTSLAESYAKSKGIDYRRQSKYVEVDVDRAKRIADEYDKMKHDPNNPKVKEAYQNLIKQTLDQYKVLKDAGYEFYFYDETNDPYNKSPWAAMEDLRNNKRMAVYSTEAGYGTLDSQDVSDNPMLDDTGFKWEFKGEMKPVLANDLFRAVHDAFGHGIEGAGFRARGEENAWQAHARLFTGSAVAAITSETRGQNSWLNYGPYGDKNKTASLDDTVFADQKTGLMPEWTWKEGFDEGVETTPNKPKVKNQLTPLEAAKENRRLNNESRERIKTKNKGLLDRFKSFLAGGLDETVDRQFSVKRALNNIGLDDVVTLMVNKAGASSLAKNRSDEAYKKTFLGLTDKQTRELENIIQLRRTVAIYENREARGLPEVKRYASSNVESARNTLEGYRQELGDKEFNMLSKRADNYFKEYKRILKEMLDEGLITEKFYDDFVEVEYKPTDYVDFLVDMDKVFIQDEIDRQSSLPLSGSPIKSFKGGSKKPEFLNAWAQMQLSILNRTKAVFNNRLNKAFVKQYEATKKEVDKLKSKAFKTESDRKKIKNFEEVSKNVKTEWNKKSKTTGYRELYYFEDGQQKSVLLKDDFYRKFTDYGNAILKEGGVKETVALATGVTAVQTFATGNNPLFFLTNTPRDFLFTLAFSKEYGKNLKEAKGITDVVKNLLGYNLVKSAAQLSVGMGKGIVSTFRKDKNFQKYLEYGGGMDFLALQGKYKDAGLVKTAIDKMFSQKTQDKVSRNAVKVALDRFNLASEVGIRLAVFNKSVSNQLDGRDINKLSKPEADMIYSNAVRSARELTDFNQGGRVTKALGVAVPYINASVQGTRAAVTNFQDRPLETSVRLLQIGSATAASIISSALGAIALFRDDDDEDTKGLSNSEIYFKTLEGVSEYDLQNYFIVPLGYKDAKGQWRYLRIAKAHAASPIINMSEYYMRKSLAKTSNVKYDSDLSKILWKTTMDNVVPLSESPMKRVPAYNASVAWLGYDAFTGNPLDWNKGKIPEQLEGYRKDNVEPLYQALGEATGESSARMQKAVESYVTTPSTNPYIGGAYILGNLTTSLIKGDKYKVPSVKEGLINPALKRLLKSTSEYNKIAKMTDRLSPEGLEAYKKSIDMEEDIKDIFKEANGDVNKAANLGAELSKSDKYSQADKLKIIKLTSTAISNSVSPKASYFMNKIKYEGNKEVRALFLYDKFGDMLLKSNERGLDKADKKLKMEILSSGALDAETILYYEEMVNKNK
ncbi:MAG: hypothetical protein HRU18_03640 [Pseudoalteromonas sp.]|uniref:hypothetical protein n=1 Tax=Pseudoalteromonas sp. TaxID=53249 RepID=UPI001DA84974|nr:hypothetical protein [Pseudoalteromonas sp.]NRA77279.1 hypothetical protein [Pseudoalteromonas sp.]